VGTDAAEKLEMVFGVLFLVFGKKNADMVA